MRKFWAYLILFGQGWCLKHMEPRDYHTIWTYGGAYKDLQYGCEACLKIKEERRSERRDRRRKRRTDRKIRALEILGRI